MPKRTYVRLTESQWDAAAEMNARGDDYETIANRFGTSVRNVATHLPPALERRRLAIASSPTASAATSPVASIAVTTIPDVTDREAATKHWRQTAWSDTQALQAKLRQELASPAPDARSIRALSAGAEALRNLIRIGSDVLEVDKNAADEIMPVLTIRELTASEVEEIRAQQRKEDNDGLEPEEREALLAFASEEGITNTAADHDVVSEE